MSTTKEVAAKRPEPEMVSVADSNVTGPTHVNLAAETLAKDIVAGRYGTESETRTAIVRSMMTLMNSTLNKTARVDDKRAFTGAVSKMTTDSADAGVPVSDMVDALEAEASRLKKTIAA